MKTIEKEIVCALSAGRSIWFCSCPICQIGEMRLSTVNPLMFLIGQTFPAYGGLCPGKAPYDKGVFAENAEVLKVLATLPWQAVLEPGTDKGDIARR